MKDNILKVKQLTKKYGDFVAVDNISFSLKRGEIFGFLGPNGAGKTTTINMLIGMAKVSSGEILYNNINRTNSIKKAQEIIGVVADESNLYPEMNGFDNLCFCGALYGVKKTTREKKSKELLELFNLSDTGKKLFQAYSKGMKRKLTIAAALMHDPDILFLDEPTSGIDVASVIYIRDIIKRLNANGTTIFLTTHYIEEAERLCDRVAFINKGLIKKIDTTFNLIKSVTKMNVIEIDINENITKFENLKKEIESSFLDVECFLKDNNKISARSKNMIDIAPIISFIAEKNYFIKEAKIIKPTLEDAFIDITGLDTANMKKDK